MAEIATIARPYAEALFRVAKSVNAATHSGINKNVWTDSPDVNAWANLLDEMAQIAQHIDVKEMVQNPKVPAAMGAEIFLSVLKSPKSRVAENFIHLLASNNRLLLLSEIAARFHVLKNAQEGAADAVISSAFALTDEQVLSLCATLESKFGRKLNPSVTVDASLIGGVRVTVGDEVLDTSVRAKLQQMQIALTA
jgi:F-type H+-transporting ATPase subunit delta